MWYLAFGLVVAALTWKWIHDLYNYPASIHNVMPHAHVMSHKVLLTANTSVPLKHWDLCPCVDIKSLFLVKVGERLPFSETWFWAREFHLVFRTRSCRPVDKAPDWTSTFGRRRRLEPQFCALVFFVLTLDFCFDYSLYIVQEVKTTATPVWVQWAHH